MSMKRLVLSAVLTGAAMFASGAGAQTAPVTPQTLPETLPEALPVTDPAAAALFDALDLTAMIAVIRDEGLVYGQSLQADLFPDNGNGWAEQVSAIYDADQMRQLFEQTMRHELDAGLVPQMLAFFNSDLGRRVTGLEISAREALLDDAVEETANQMRDDLAAAKTGRYAGLQRFVEVNDLIEANVSGALNANLAFYQGLSDGGAFPTPMSESDILRDVWTQEPAVRTDTADWLMAYLGLAYQPLSDADLDAYIEFSLTPAGRAVNQAQFVAFDRVFGDISRRLGMAAATHMASEAL